MPDHYKEKVASLKKKLKDFAKGKNNYSRMGTKDGEYSPLTQKLKKFYKGEYNYSRMGDRAKKQKEKKKASKKKYLSEVEGN